MNAYYNDLPRHSMKTKQHTRQKIKARQMWANPAQMVMCQTNYCGDLTPYAVLDVSDPDALVEQAAKVLVEEANLNWASADEWLRIVYRKSARAVLRSLNLLPPTKKGGAK